MIKVMFISIGRDIQEDMLTKVVIKGIKDITNIVMSEVNIHKYIEGEIVKSDNTWMLETDGVNLLDVFNSQYVDYVKTFSNDIIEVFDVNELKQQTHF